MSEQDIDRLYLVSLLWIKKDRFRLRENFTFNSLLHDLTNLARAEKSSLSADLSDIIY